MTEEAGTHYAKLLGETAAVSWEGLEPFVVRRTLLEVAGDCDLVEAALAVSQDDRAKVAQWMGNSKLGRIEVEQEKDWQARDPELWALVIAPWVLVQKCGAQ